MEIVNKPWGIEHILEVNDKYVMKKLIIGPKKMTSLQYHEFKHETIHIISGVLHLHLAPKQFSTKKCANSITRIRLEPGMTYAIEPRRVHRFENDDIENQVILIEGSTTEINDVVRLDDEYGRT